MSKKPKSRLESKPKQYDFVMNPYPFMKMTKCPFCDKKTGQRKRPLVIHIDPQQLMVLNYTCRYCKSCDLLVVHKHEIEHHMNRQMSIAAPDVIGNSYLIMGTVDRKIWKENMDNPKSPKYILEHLVAFQSVYNELRVTQVGWFPADVEPGIEEPPPSQEWVKR